MITHHKTLITTLILAGGLLFSSNAHAAGNTYYVAKTGSDSNSCTAATNPATPKLTISGSAGGVTCLQGGGDTLSDAPRLETVILTLRRRASAVSKCALNHAPQKRHGPLQAGHPSFRHAAIGVARLNRATSSVR